MNDLPLISVSRQAVINATENMVRFAVNPAAGSCFRQPDINHFEL